MSDSCVKLESRCDKGEYLAEDGKCYDCDESCAECVGESWLECTKCKEGSHIELIKHLYWGMCACNGQ